MASFFGTGPTADAFQFSFLLVDTLAGGVLGAAAGIAFLPPLVAALKEGEDHFRSLASKGLFPIALVGLILSLGLYLFAPSLVTYLGPGFPPATAKITTSFIRLMAPTAFFTILMAYFTALSQARLRFLVPAAAPAIIDLISLVILVAGIKIIGPASAPLGILTGSAAAALVVFLSLPGKSSLFAKPAFHPALPQVGLIFAPAFFVNASGYFISLVERFLASELPSGTVAALSFASKASSGAQLLLLSAFSTVLFPTLASHAATSDKGSFGKSLGRGTLLILGFGLTSLFILELFGFPILALVFHRGAFSLTSVATTSRILSTYALSIVPLGLSALFLRALYALNQAKAALFFVVIGTVINVSGDFLLLPFLRELTFGAGMTIGSSFTAALAWNHLRRQINV